MIIENGVYNRESKSSFSRLKLIRINSQMFICLSIDPVPNLGL